MKKQMFQPMTVVILCLFLFVGMLTGCNEEATVTTAEDPIAELQQVKPGSLRSIGVPNGMTLSADLTMEERQARTEAILTAVLAVKEATKTTEWQEADRSVRSLILSPPDGLQPFALEQVGAQIMLSRFSILEGENTASKQAVTSFYTDLLIKNNNPDAEWLLVALKRLEGYHTEQELAQRAGQIAEAAQAKLALQSNCPNCDIEELFEAIPSLKEVQSKHFYNTLEAIEELQEIASR